MSGLCKDCKWWVVLDVDTLIDCENHPSFAGVCGRARSVDGSPVDDDTLAFAQDDDHWTATLRTKATFGCVMFEANP